MYNLSVSLINLNRATQDELSETLADASSDYFGLFIGDIFHNFDKGISHIDINVDATRPAEAYSDVVYFFEDLNLMMHVDSIETNR